MFKEKNQHIQIVPIAVDIFYNSAWHLTSNVYMIRIRLTVEPKEEEEEKSQTMNELGIL